MFVIDEVILLAIIIVIITLRVFLRYKIKICLAEKKMNGKVVIVTGTNSGIGFHTAQDLAKRGARVILACRDERRAFAARDEIISQTGYHEVVYKNLGLTSLESFRKFSDDIASTERRLDVLVNNAGLLTQSGRRPTDGIVVEVQVNFVTDKTLLGVLFSILCWFCYRSAWEGAQSVVSLCVEDECGTVSGKFFVDGVPGPSLGGATTELTFGRSLNN